LGSWRYGWWLVSLVHVVVLLAAHQDIAWPDSQVYLRMAQNLWDHGVLSQLSQPTPSLHPETHRLPGYPVFLLLMGTGLSASFGTAMALVLQHALVLVNGVLVGRLLKPHISAHGAQGAGRLYALMPYTLIFANLLLTETLFITLMLALVRVWQRAWLRQGGIRWTDALLMAVLGLAATSLKGLALPVYGLAAGSLGVRWLIRQWLGKLGWQPLTGHVLGLLVLLAGLGGWMARNQAVSGQFTLSTAQHIPWWYGRLGGVLALQSGEDFTDATLIRLATAFGEANIPPGDSLYTYPAPQLTDLEFQRLHPDAKAAGRAYLAEHWLRTLQLHAWAVVQQWQGVGYGTWRRQTGAEVVAVGAAIVQAVFNLWLLAGLVRYGWRLGCRRPEYRVPALLHLCVAIALVFMLLHAAAWADGRYRIIADPFMWVVTVWGLRARPSGHHRCCASHGK